MKHLHQYQIFYAITILFLSITACNQSAPSNTTKPVNNYVKLSGSTMGTTYHITAETQYPDSLQKEVELILSQVNGAVNTYLDNSLITLFNKSEKGIDLAPDNTPNDILKNHFLKNFKQSVEVHKNTKGSFDPTVMPLVSYWGFARKKQKVEKIDQPKIDSLIQFVGLEKVKLNDSNFLSKSHKNVSLDFSAIAKGYGIDVICEMLDKKAIDNYFVEIGGEVRTKGKNPRNTPWVIGISTPDPKAALQDLYAQVKLSGIALASSGNYRNYYEVNGERYGHTINPKTGLPETSKLLSASIFAKDCMTADAYATACMTMGIIKSVELINQIDGIEGYFIYDDNGSFAVKKTKGAQKYLIGTSHRKGQH